MCRKLISGEYWCSDLNQLHHCWLRGAGRGPYGQEQEVRTGLCLAAKQTFTWWKLTNKGNTWKSFGTTSKNSTRCFILQPWRLVRKQVTCLSPFQHRSQIHSQKREIFHMGLIPWNDNISSVTFAKSTHLGSRKLWDLFGIHKTSLKKPQKFYLS